jgi:hypothetical protein
LDDTGWCDFHDGVFGVHGSEGGENGGTDFHDCCGGFSSEVEVSQVLTDGEVGFLLDPSARISGNGRRNEVHN